MNKKIKVFFAVTVFLLLSLICTNVKAASASISASASSITVGKSATVTVTIKAAAWSVKVSGAASGNITGYSANEKNVTTTKKYTVTAKKAGQYTVKISGDVTDANGKEVSVNKSVTITAKEKTNNNDNNNNNDTNTKKSTDATLSNLGVTPSKYDFSGFKKAVTGANAEYKVKVPNSVTKLSVYATPSDKKATYSVSGNTGFKVGTNVISVKVTAEDKKTTKTYKIYVTREAEDEEVTPNIIEDDEEEEEEKEPEEGIGLKSLKVEGYELDEKFSTTLLDYNVEVGKDKLTVAELRNKIIAKVNYSKAKANIEIEEGEDSDYYRYIATITVKDDKKEYAVYTLKFVESLEMVEEVEDEEENKMPEDVEAAAKTTKTPKKELWFGHDKDFVQKCILFGICVILLIVCIVLAVKNKKQNDILNDYDDDDYDEPEDKVEELDSDIEKSYEEEPKIEKADDSMSDEEAVLRHFGLIKENKTAIEAEKSEKEDLRDDESEERYVPKFRNPRSRNTRKPGRHF